jgi:hypothetical protein
MNRTILRNGVPTAWKGVILECVCGLFGSFQYLGHTASDGRIIGELERIWKKEAVA